MFIRTAPEGVRLFEAYPRIIFPGCHHAQSGELSNTLILLECKGRKILDYMISVIEKENLVAHL